MPKPAHDANPASAGECPSEQPALRAVLMIDAAGRIVALNESARQLWRAFDRSLVGSTVADLFSLGLGSTDAEAKETLWKALRIETLDRWTTATACALDQSAHEVRLRIERSIGGAGSYIATIEAQPSPHAR